MDEENQKNEIGPENDILISGLAKSEYSLQKEQENSKLTRFKILVKRTFIILKKIIHGTINAIMYPFKLFKDFFIDNHKYMFMVELPGLLISLLGTGVILFHFKNIKEDTSNITNYGFAILAGISSICFSWIKTLDKEIEPEMIKKITHVGESFFYCSILFLILSALKYSSLHLEYIIPKSFSPYYNFVYWTTLVTHSFCFTYTFLKLDLVFNQLNILLFQRLNKNETKYY